MQQATISTYMPGDILFYGQLPGDVYDTAITMWTNSPFVHTAIAISAVQKIEELSNGVVLTPLDDRAVLAAYRFTKRNKVDANLLHNALVWLISQKGNLYGYGDVAIALLERFESHVVVLDKAHFDCSALCTEFLQKAGC